MLYIYINIPVFVVVYSESSRRFHGQVMVVVGAIAVWSDRDRDRDQAAVTYNYWYELALK